MSTKHSKAAEKFLQNKEQVAWHNETLWMVRAKRDKMSRELSEWEDLREKACQLKLYSNSHLEELLVDLRRTPQPMVLLYTGPRMRRSIATSSTTCCAATVSSALSRANPCFPRNANWILS